MRIIKLLCLVLTLHTAQNLLAQWTVDLEIAYNHSYEQVYIVDSIHAWAIGHYQGFQDSSVLMRRESYSPWSQHYLSIANSNNFTCVYAHDSDKAWVGTADGKVYYISYNENKVILQINTGGQGYINDIKFSRFNQKYGYVYSDPPNGAGTPFKIYKTTNSGVNWIELSPFFGGTYVGAAYSMCVTDSDHVWLGLNCQPSFCQTPKVAYTTNGGLSWQMSTIPNGSNYISAVTFKYNNTYGIVSPWDQVPTYLFRSLNGGASWSFLYNTQLSQPVNSLCWAEGTNTWYYCSNLSSNQINKSTDDGLSWNTMVVPANTGQIASMDIVTIGNKAFGYAVSFNGRILKMIDSVGLIGIQNINSDVPKGFALHQNYPNPFNPVTNIKFDIPKAGNVSLKVFDITGKEVAELVNENMAAGSYTYDFDASKLSSGVYFYRIKTDSYTNIKKMMLVK